MIRIQTANDAAGTMIAIDGQLAGEYVDEVRTCLQRAMQELRPVHLFLRDVSHIDETGQALLSELAAHGVELSASGVYSSYVVTELLREPGRSRRLTSARAEIPSADWKRNPL